ncbi:hypothetical protein JST99_02830 [Candidatus Dependentiae bacterium]|nr:hypothetical protein [Candidatus Dependentiae bacterium]
MKFLSKNTLLVALFLGAPLAHARNDVPRQQGSDNGWSAAAITAVFAGVTSSAFILGKYFYNRSFDTDRKTIARDLSASKNDALASLTIAEINLKSLGEGDSFEKEFLKKAKSSFAEENKDIESPDIKPHEPYLTERISWIRADYAYRVGIARTYVERTEREEKDVLTAFDFRKRCENQSWFTLRTNDIDGRTVLFPRARAFLDWRIEEAYSKPRRVL